MRAAPDLTGLRFSRLVVVGRLAPQSGTVMYECVCDCGRTHRTSGHSLRSQRVKSCGCLNQEMRLARNYRHGMARRGELSPEYGVWQAVIARCTNPKNKRWAWYGGRGVRICQRWRHDFAAFLADMGPRPSPHHSIDRINSDGDYEPGNCRWASPREQYMNRKAQGTGRRPISRGPASDSLQ